jgi:actin
MNFPLYIRSLFKFIYMTEASPIVIDNGSGVCKAGECKNGQPSSVFPSIVGIPKVKNVIEGLDPKELYLGSEANEKRGVLNITYPIEHGVITNWTFMEALWRHVFVNELRVTPEERSVMLTEAPLNPKNNREKMAEIMFEKIGIKKLYVGVQAVLALYASGRTTGLVVDSGDGVTHTVPVYEGYNIAHAIRKQNLAGRDVTTYLKEKVLTEINVNLVSSAETEITRDIKEKCSLTAFDAALEPSKKDGVDRPPDYFANELKKTPESITYQLPDGKIITLGAERFRGAELLFNPAINGSEYKPIYDLVMDSIQAADIDTRKAFYENIILSGGTTMFKNFPERLEKSMAIIAPAAIQPKVFASPERKYMVWLGAATAVTISSFGEKWIDKDEWKENQNVIHTKCV